MGLKDCWTKLRKLRCLLLFIFLTATVVLACWLVPWPTTPNTDLKLTVENGTLIHVDPASLKDLTLDFSNFTNISSSSFQDIRLFSLSLRNGTAADCTPQSVDFEAELFANQTGLEELHLQCVSLPSRPNLLQHLRSVTTLSLTSVNFPTFAQHFGGLSGLQALTLKNVGIGAMSQKTWSNATDNLDTLMIEDVIRSVAAKSFARFGNLSTLVMTKGQIGDVPDLAFFGLGNVTRLNLTANGIKGIHRDTFEGLVKLERLVLRSNRIASIPPRAFEKTVLERLDLSRNSLMVVDAMVFSDLPELQILDLSFNAIKEVKPDALVGLPMLQVLKLEHNRITDVSGQYREVLVKKLGLAYNLIEKLGSRCFDSVEIGFLDLTANNITSVAADAFFNATIDDLTMCYRGDYPLLNVTEYRWEWNIDDVDVQDLYVDRC